MTKKHQTGEYQRNATLRRKQVRAAWALGEPVRCWRGGGIIHPGQPYDIGHLDPQGGNALDNLLPEHRSRVETCCKGNRSHGGTIGATITNTRRRPTTEASTWAL